MPVAVSPPLLPTVWSSVKFQRVAYRNLLPLGDREGAISGQVRRPACVIKILDLQDYGLESKYFTTITVRFLVWVRHGANTCEGWEA